MSLAFAHDYAAASVDQTLNGIHFNNTEVLIEVRPTNAARSTTNPAFTMSGVLPSYVPLDGAVGDLSEMTAEFSNSGTSGIQRLTA